MNTIDLEGFRRQIPTTGEVIANMRPDAMDSVTSAWEARDLGRRVLLVGLLSPDGVPTWWLPLPFEQLPTNTRPEMRAIEVFPPPDSAPAMSWSWRPLNAETWAPSSWGELAQRLENGKGRKLYEDFMKECRAEFGDEAGPTPLSNATVQKCQALERHLRVRSPGLRFVIAPRYDSEVMMDVSHPGLRVTISAMGYPTHLLRCLSAILGVAQGVLTIPAPIIPESTIPESTIPESTIPESTIPESTIPAPTIPAPTIPTPFIIAPFPPDWR